MPEVMEPGETAAIADVVRSRQVQIKDARAVIYEDRNGIRWVDLEVGIETVCLKAQEFFRWSLAVQDELEREGVTA